MSKIFYHTYHQNWNRNFEEKKIQKSHFLGLECGISSKFRVNIFEKPSSEKGQNILLYIMLTLQIWWIIIE